MSKNLTEHLYELFRSEKYDDVYVQTDKAYFSVWEGNPLKVNGDEFTWDEFNKMLSSICSSLVTCDGISFQKVGNEFFSSNLGFSSNLIHRVLITLDDNLPEFMGGIIRISSVISYDKEDNIVGDHQDLVDNREFNDEIELLVYVAKKLVIDKNIIEIID